ncbi:hypothetical protein NEOLEDRAFT_1166707 [Neolentinus lepideus HHB14362 ss-1]|uniref:Uncharacterized protein n=1 Tax=Neolentinus lepideus HHB14362 ss-1 TaxID=1314782 RepID=A0A165VM91_9AGAM|nr:hypothetical protein NEOLEDRAFT_1166707 [Neolentinus lepideus HHB14362 ss-1]
MTSHEATLLLSFKPKEIGVFTASYRSISRTSLSARLIGSPSYDWRYYRTMTCDQISDFIKGTPFEVLKLLIEFASTSIGSHLYVIPLLRLIGADPPCCEAIVEIWGNRGYKSIQTSNAGGTALSFGGCSVHRDTQSKTPLAVYTPKSMHSHLSYWSCTSTPGFDPEVYCVGSLSGMIHLRVIGIGVAEGTAIHNRPESWPGAVERSVGTGPYYMPSDGCSNVQPWLAQSCDSAFTVAC